MTKKKVEKNYRGADYHCHECKDPDLKLWREYNTFSDYTDLLCYRCTLVKRAAYIAKHPPDEDSREGYQLGGMIPACSTKEGDSFWGMSSTTQEAWLWWQGRPLVKDDPVAELAWLKPRFLKAVQEVGYYSTEWVDVVGYKRLAEEHEKLSRELSKAIDSLYPRDDGYWKDEHNKIRARLMELIERRERMEASVADRKEQESR